MIRARPLSLRFLGPMEVARGGEPVVLPPSRKTRALLAYLVASGRECRRERLVSLLWDVTDDPRGGLRWSLSKLRALDDEDARRIVADRDAVRFDPRGAYVDILAVDQAFAGGLDGASIVELRELAATFRGGFLEGLELTDFDEFQAWCAAQRAHWHVRHLEVLERLVAALADRPEEALAPARERVRISPDDEQARATLVELLGAAGRRQEAEEHYHLGRRQLERTPTRETGALRDAWRKVSGARPAASAADEDVRRQEIRFCTASDGVRIAYASLGEGPPLLKAANWLSHLEYDWKSPLWRHMARDLSSQFRLVRYDQRGCGLSDREVDVLSLETFVDDLACVADASGLERFALLGISQGSRASIAYAVAHPERVSHLVLYGGGARGWRHRKQGALESRLAMQTLMRQGWGRDNPAFRQVFTSLFMPDASPEQMSWFNELQRVSSSPETAVRISDCSGSIDVLPLLEQIRVPTLVMHATHDAVIPFEEGRILAAGIPDARFVALDSRNHLLLDDEPAWARFLSEIRSFLGS